MNENEHAVVSTREAWFVPIAILAAGLIFSVAIFVHRSNKVEGSVQADITLMHPVSQADHLAGNPAAPVILVEYADIDSSYAKTFQQTLEQLASEHAATGDFAWAYRHLPLIDQHVYAAQHAEAAECAASLGGPTMFWRFIDALNSAAPGDLQFDPKNYPGVVSSLGLLPESFTACMSAHTYQKKVASDFENGIAIGAGGSPFSVLLVKGQPPITIDGSVPYDGMKKIIDQAIEKAKSASTTQE
jgi:protein-disulfide isomerase